MSRFEKLLSRIMLLDNNMRFEELKKVLESYGYTMRSPAGGSSHMTFRKPGKPPITIPVHEPIKKTYVMLVRDAIERSEKDDEIN